MSPDMKKTLGKSAAKGAAATAAKEVGRGLLAGSFSENKSLCHSSDAKGMVIIWIKRFLALLAALILCLGLVACGSGEKDWSGEIH